MRLYAMTLLLCLAPLQARADDDADAQAAEREGEKVKLRPGEVHKVVVPPGSQVICDDPAVAMAGEVDDSLALVAQGVGRTTCGARFNGSQRGLWRVVVENDPDAAKEKGKDKAKRKSQEPKPAPGKRAAAPPEAGDAPPDGDAPARSPERRGRGEARPQNADQPKPPPDGQTPREEQNR